MERSGRRQRRAQERAARAIRELPDDHFAPIRDGLLALFMLYPGTTMRVSDAAEALNRSEAEILAIVERAYQPRPMIERHRGEDSNAVRLSLTDTGLRYLVFAMSPGGGTTFGTMRQIARVSDPQMRIHFQAIADCCPSPIPA